MFYICATHDSTYLTELISLNFQRGSSQGKTIASFVKEMLIRRIWDRVTVSLSDWIHLPKCLNACYKIIFPKFIV